MITARLGHFINAATSGWTALWCPLYQFPEMAIQIIAGDAIDQAARFFGEPYEKHRQLVLGRTIPFSNIETRYVGDRYGEIPADIPRGADFAVQVQAGRERSYYWWLADVAMRDVPERLMTLRFGQDGNGAAVRGQGWSGAERDGTWMENFKSEIFFPQMPRRAAYRLSIDTEPFITVPRLRRQRLSVDINGTNLGQFCCAARQLVILDIPPHAMRRDKNILTFVHPDAESPVDCGLGNDRRILSFFILHVSLDGY